MHLFLDNPDTEPSRGVVLSDLWTGTTT